MKKIHAIALASAFGLAGCVTNERGAREALIKEHLQPVSIGGYDYTAGIKHPIACQKNDTKTRFEAKDAANQTVKGVVCGNVFRQKVIPD